MDLSRVGPDMLEALVNLLPGKQTPVAYMVRLADRSLYIASTNHLPWRLTQMLMAGQGRDNTASKAVARAGGVSRLEAFTIMRTEAGAVELAAKWTEQARKRGEKISTDEMAEQNREQAGREAFMRDAPLGERGDF